MGNITWQDKAGGRGKTLKLAGALTIEAASELRDALLHALETAEPLEMDLSAVESVDLACMQVLCSAHCSFHQADRKINLAGGISAGIHAALEALAISPDACDSPCSLECPWKKGEKP
ncbi:MAG TPA: STAS domain-containing protein [Deltaproteobacteria bacterium]|nr:STAS domain-containing protein [Deltaproteobacteria bacterium]